MKLLRFLLVSCCVSTVFLADGAAEGSSLSSSSSSSSTASMRDHRPHAPSPDTASLCYTLLRALPIVRGCLESHRSVAAIAAPAATYLAHLATRRACIDALSVASGAVLRVLGSHKSHPLVLAPCLRFLGLLAAALPHTREPVNAVPAAAGALVTHRGRLEVVEVAAQLLSNVAPVAGATCLTQKVVGAVLGALEVHGPPGAAPAVAHALLDCVSSMAFHGSAAELPLPRTVPLVIATTLAEAFVGNAAVAAIGLTCLGNLATLPRCFSTCVWTPFFSLTYRRMSFSAPAVGTFVNGAGAH